MALKTGDKLVHKTHGVGIISGIETKNYGGGPQDYYLLKICSTGLIVRFPKGAESAVVRDLVTNREIDKVYSILKSPSNVYSVVWNRRKKELSEKIKSGSLYEMAEVLRDLSRLKSEKELSFGEKEMLEKAKERLVDEISAATASECSRVEEQLNQILLPH
ncbi:MAG: CarD family transcriptional regulator [Oligoflexales bacterium]